jgi:hypothetical protein
VTSGFGESGEAEQSMGTLCDFLRQKRSRPCFFVWHFWRREQAAQTSDISVASLRESKVVARTMNLDIESFGQRRDRRRDRPFFGCFEYFRESPRHQMSPSIYLSETNLPTRPSSWSVVILDRRETEKEAGHN